MYVPHAMYVCITKTGLTRGVINIIVKIINALDDLNTLANNVSTMIDTTDYKDF